MRALALALVAAAAAAPLAWAERVYPRPGAVTALGTSEFDVAYALALPGGCHEVRVWRSTGTDRRVARQCFETTSTGSGIAAVAYAGGRALWLSYTGGNVREWSLWTKGGGSARRVAFEAVDVDEPAPILVATSSEWALAYAARTRVVAFDPRGRRLFAYETGARVTALSTQQRGVAAVLESGRVVALDYKGRVVAERAYAPGEPQAAELSTVGLVVQTRAGIERGGASYPLPAGSRWLGYASGMFAFGVGRRLYLGRISDGTYRLVRRFERPFTARLGRITLATASGSTLTRERRADVDARIRGG